MNLKSGIPFWLIQSGLPYNYPKLDTSVKTEILIIGGGISGALTAYHLARAGIDCVVVDAREIGMGSSCASTSLLQYELDMPLHILANTIGMDNAVRTYKLCSEAVDKLKNIAHKIGLDEFETKKSLFYASKKIDVKLLKEEYEIKKKNKFKVHFLEEKEIIKRFNFSAPAAILSDTAAETNAYQFTHQLHQYSLKKGIKVFERTEIKKFAHIKNGISATTTNGHNIKAKKVVYATGYEALSEIDKKIAKLYSTYAIVSEKIDNMDWWNAETILWNTADPYLYMRAINDNRILVGGRDESFYTPEKRDKLIEKKSALLAKDFIKLFPGKVITPQFKWTGTFAVTKDSMPFIGEYHKKPNSYFSLGYGGNGIIFSLLAAEIICDLITGRKNDDAHIFSFDRL